MIDREIILTPEGYQRLKEEIEYLSSVKRDEVADRIRASRDFGDISENSEYDDAKNEQAMLEARIYALEEKIRSAIVIDSDTVTTDKVGVGTKVTLQDMQRGDIVQYSIVGSAEADPSRAQALQRVARRPRHHRPQARRQGRPCRCRRAPASSRSWLSRKPDSPPVDEHTDHGDVFAERRDKLAAWRETGAAYPTEYQPRDEIATLRAAYERARARAGLRRDAPRRRPRHGPPRARQGLVRRRSRT